MNDSDDEMPLQDARKILGELADAARLAGRTTILTRRGRPIARIAPLETPMTVTTSYGSWSVGSTVRVEDYVAEGIDSDFAADYDFDGIAADFRAAINDALPEGVSLNGNEFYGPVERPDYDLAAILGDIDFWAIAAKHDRSA